MHEGYKGPNGGKLQGKKAAMLDVIKDLRRARVEQYTADGTKRSADGDDLQDGAKRAKVRDRAATTTSSSYRSAWKLGGFGDQPRGASLMSALMLRTPTAISTSTIGPPRASEISGKMLFLF